MSLYFDTSNLRPYELLTNHYRHSSRGHPTAHFTDATLTHNIPTSESHKGVLPWQSSQRTDTISEPNHHPPTQNA